MKIRYFLFKNTKLLLIINSLIIVNTTSFALTNDDLPEFIRLDIKEKTRCTTEVSGSCCLKSSLPGLGFSNSDIDRSIVKQIKNIQDTQSLKLLLVYYKDTSGNIVDTIFLDKIKEKTTSTLLSKGISTLTYEANNEFIKKKNCYLIEFRYSNLDFFDQWSDEEIANIDVSTIVRIPLYPATHSGGNFTT